MARGRRRLERFLTGPTSPGDGSLGGIDVEADVDAAETAISADELVEVATWLAARPSPFGNEGPLARELVAWGSARWPELTFTIDEFGTPDHDRANVVVTAGSSHPSTGRHPSTERAPARPPILGFYAHLDTTLRGDDGDTPVTGDASSPATARVDSEADGSSTLVGLGLSVAKAPVAAALVALATATRALRARGVDHQLSLLLAAGGTHRLAPGSTPAPGQPVQFGVGVERALAAGYRPDAVVNVKGGAPSPLRAEPGAAYLRIEVTAPWEPALFRGEHPGLIGAVGPLLAAVEEWRRDVRARPIEQPAPGVAEIGREVALGALRVGDLDKPDLLPGRLEAHVFVVLAPGDDVEAMAGELRDRLGPAASAVAAGARVSVGVLATAPAASTDADEPIVALVDDAWRRRFGPPPSVGDWRGSTDGVVLRSAGIPTVRVGPVIGRDPADLRLDRVDLATAAEFARLYAEVAVRWAHEHADRR